MVIAVLSIRCFPFSYLQVILKNATLEERKELLKGLEYMSSPKKMGMRFKMLAMTQKGAVVPPPFVINGAGDGASSS